MSGNKKDKNNNSKYLIFVFVICIIIGFIIGLTGVTGSLFENLTFERIVFFIAALYVSVFININIHEFGHFIFGKMTGYRLVAYRVSVFSWSYENGKMKFSIIRNKGYSGLCSMIPPEHEMPVYKHLLYFSGGILLNILTGIVALSVAIAYPTIEYTNTFLVTLAEIALLFGIINLMPIISGNSPSDGKVIWSLLLKKPYSEGFLTIFRLSALLASSARPRDLEIPDLSVCVSASRAAILLYSYFKSIDSDDIDSAIAYADKIEDNIDLVPFPALPGYYYELCFTGCITGNRERAESYYKKAGKILQNDKDINGMRVKAYYEHYINNNNDLAISYCNQALMVKDKFPLKGQAEMEEDLVRRLIGII